MKRLMLLSILFPLIFLVNGCGFKDIDKRFFVVSVGVDKPKKPEHKFKVILKLAIPSATEKFGANQFTMAEEEGENISDAVRLIKSKVDKELDFGQLKVILFGEELVKGGVDINELTDWFVRRRDVQRIAWLGIGKPSAESVLALKPKAERLPSNALILSFGQAGTESAYISSEYLFDFRARLKERGLDPFLPVIEIPKGNGMFTTNTVALFDKHGLKTILSPDETKALNAIGFGIAKVDIVVGQGKDAFIVSAENIKSSFQFHDEGGKPSIVMNVNIQGTVEESRSKLSAKELSHYEDMTNQYAQQRVLKLLKKLQKENVDPVGFGLRYRARHFNNKNEWEEWKSIYPTIDFQVNVTTKLRGTGLIE